jgi:signal transduction histidine kinase
MLEEAPLADSNPRSGPGWTDDHAPAGSHPAEGQAAPLVAEALHHAQEGTDELRELAHGILPSVLTRGGLRAGVDALASRMPVPVEIGVSVERLAPEVGATAYFVVAEALTNVAKHSHADRAAVSAEVENGDLHIEVRDDGIGGAKAAGTGLVGLADRIAALDGTLRLKSPTDGGTLVAADIPCARREVLGEDCGEIGLARSRHRSRTH